MNNICISGRLTRDVEIKTFDGGKVGNFCVAVNGRRGKDGENVDFFNCQAWNGTAEVIAKYLHKGDPIEIMGEMRSSKKDDRIYWTLNVKEWHFVQSSKSNGGAHDAIERGLKEASEDEASELPF